MMIHLRNGHHIIGLREQRVGRLLDLELDSHRVPLSVVQSLPKEVVPMSVETLLLQNVLEKYSHLPMAEERRSFLAYKLEAGSSWSTLRQIAITMAAAVDRMKLTPETKLSPDQIERAAQDWADRHPRATNLLHPETVARRFKFIVATWFSFMGRLDLPEPRPDPYAVLLKDYAVFSREVRGLAPATIEAHCESARRFLRSQKLERIENHESGMKAINDHVMELKARGWSRVGMAGHIYKLRAFFRYAEQKGKLPRPKNWAGCSSDRSQLVDCTFRLGTGQCAT